jgi:hypothetical protein
MQEVIDATDKLWREIMEALAYLAISVVAIQIGVVVACMFIAWKQEMMHWFVVFMGFTLISIFEFVVLYTRHIP